MNTKLELQAKHIAKHATAIEDLEQKLDSNAERLREDIKEMFQETASKQDQSLEELKRLISAITMSKK